MVCLQEAISVSGSYARCATMASRRWQQTRLGSLIGTMFFDEWLVVKEEISTKQCAGVNLMELDETKGFCTWKEKFEVVLVR